ncbi:WYL domain-containing protein [Phenylobacterium sp.]|uniref:WYL domain-containing protein n=1 Tax=Phenylobacterium sp. TaxID=1871053 RepID=UPI0035ADD658
MGNDRDTGKIRWGAEQRLEFIEFRAFWEGGVNRSDLMERFGVSTPQASNDLSQYRELAPDNLAYDASAKRYVASEAFKPVFLAPNPDRYLSQLRARAEGVLSAEETWLGALPVAEAMPIPARKVDAGLFRQLLAVIREGGSVEVLYQSMSPERPDSLWRRVTPHAFATDGLRWHVRAYCHLDSNYKDFILSRWRSLRSPGPAGRLAESDKDWRETFSVVLEPNPALSKNQRDAVAWEYDMPNGSAVLAVRKAMLYYLKKRLRLDVLGDAPAETPVVVANRDAFENALASANGEVMGA